MVSIEDIEIYVQEDIHNIDSIELDELTIDSEAVQERFRGMAPATTYFWFNVWEQFGVDKLRPIHRTKLYRALEFSGLLQHDVIPAIHIGLISGEIVRVGQEDEAFRLSNPHKYRNPELSEKYLVPVDLADSTDSDDTNDDNDADTDQLVREKAIERFGVDTLDPDESGIPYFKQFLNLHTTSESPDDADEEDEVFVTTSDLRDAYNTWAAIQIEYPKQHDTVDEPDIETELSPQVLGQKVVENADVEKGQKRINGTRARVYRKIRLTPRAKQLFDVDI